ncbi:hypothetical protein [Litorimonas sp. WD9-15]|uniref:hypothetical protein n=1 Tax=Litorimonas sp. WD9-15 TaxID=3418716 RepID=UPI003D019F58
MMKPISSAFILLIATSLPAASHAEGALDWATGSWGIDVENIPEDLTPEQIDSYRNCDTSPVRITIDKENLRYKAIHTGENDFTSTSPVLDVQERWITLQYDDETRTLENGDLHKWHMFFVSPDKFYWIVGEGVGENEREGVVPVARVRCQFKGV